MASFPRPLRLYVWTDNNIVMTTTNQNGKVILNPNFQRDQPPVKIKDIAAHAWPAWRPEFKNSYSFQIPVLTNVVFQTNSTYRHETLQFVPITGIFEPSTRNQFYADDWRLDVGARLRFAVVDTSTTPTRIVDYVNLAASNSVDLTWELMSDEVGDGSPSRGDFGSLWSTNRYPTNTSIPTFGVRNQIEVSLGRNPAYGEARWLPANNDFAPNLDKNWALDSFRHQFGLSPMFPHPLGTVFYPSNTFDAPFQPSRNIWILTAWKANDPLVHYTTCDLTSLLDTNVVVLGHALDGDPNITTNLGQVSLRYKPWGYAAPFAGGSGSATDYELGVKDPLVIGSDSWDFPTNKLPNVGWLGRVHRGTPWQTVYLKSPAIDPTIWRIWSGNGQIVTNIGQFPVSLLPLYVPGTSIGLANDSILTQPTNDWRLMDLFTTALNDNSTRGQLSINQPSLAAWSAVLGGVIALTNGLDANGNRILLPHVIDPAGVYNPFDPTNWPPVVQLVKRINDVRATNSTRHVFSRLGDILAVPEFTVSSPFLNTNGTPSLPNSALNDAAYERLPQQILGLLKCDHTPRFVIYTWGQTLKPAAHAIVQSGPFAGLCTNYQIVAEAATRTVVRLDGVQRSSARTLPPPIGSLHPVIESFNALPPD